MSLRVVESYVPSDRGVECPYVALRNFDPAPVEVKRGRQVRLLAVRGKYVHFS